MIGSLADFYPDAKWQRCVVHFYRNVFTTVPKFRVKNEVALLESINSREDREAAEEKIAAVVKKTEKDEAGQCGGAR